MTHANAKQPTGFTIVELLIVIVVIAILAAIGITAYDGIQQRSRNSQTITGAKQYIKAVHLYAAAKGSYPTVVGCLGEGYEYQGIVGRCGGEAGSVNVNPTFDAQIGEFLSSKPRLNTKNLTIRPDAIRAGGYYNPNVNGNATIYYILEGKSESCTAGGDKVINADAPDMFCSYTFPPL